jgi:hypothetical protein
MNAVEAVRGQKTAGMCHNLHRGGFYDGFYGGFYDVCEYAFYIGHTKDIAGLFQFFTCDKSDSFTNRRSDLARFNNV